MTVCFDASEVDNWSDRADAEYMLPELARRLVLATLPEPPSWIDIPSGSSVRMPGWDGCLEVARGNPWVPDKVSAWEMSCDKKVTGKANKDYKKRTENPLGLDIAATTLVFVTSRRWLGKRQWETDHRAEGLWADVRALNADDLVAWLEQSSEVSQWFASVIDRRAFDYGAITRIEELQTETVERVTAGSVDVAEIRKGMRTLLASVQSQAEPSDQESALNPVQQELSKGMEFAALNKGLILLTNGLPGEARKCLESIEDPEVRAASLLPLAGACLESGDPAAAATLLENSFTLDRPEKEDLGRAELLLQAETEIGTNDSVGPALEAALRQHQEEPRLLALAALHSSLHDDAEGAVATLSTAIELADEPDRQAFQAQLGNLYESMGRSTDAATAFEQACGDDASHPAAVSLLISLANSQQLRKALDLARQIRDLPDTLSKVVIEIEAHILEYVGDARAAVLRRRELCARNDSTPDDQVMLAQAYLRCGERDQAMQTIVDIDVTELHHEPQVLMKLAYMKRLLGAADYLHDAYLARRCGVNEPEMHLGYLRLFQSRGEDWEEPETVGPGCAVRLKSEDEEQWWYILEPGEDPHRHRDVSPEQDLAQRLLGHSAGKTIVLRQGLEDLSYEITEIQSKFVRIYQESLEEFSTRLPDNMSLSRVKIDNELSKIYQSVDARDKFVRNIESLYESGQLPFTSFCSFVGTSTFEVWPDYIGQLDRPSARLRFGTGTEEEANESSALLAHADSVVLDIVSLLTTHSLGLAENLRTRFTHVAIPQQVFDELQDVVLRAEDGSYSLQLCGKGLGRAVHAN